MTTDVGVPNGPASPRGGRADAAHRVLRVVLVVNAFILGAKLGVGLRTHALAVLGAALESGLDLLNNAIGMTLLSISGRAPDEDHPYGHAKFETVGTVVVVGFLSVSCFELLRQGIVSLLYARVPHQTSAVEAGVILVTLLLNAGVVWYERARGQALASAFLRADAVHGASDLFVTALALASILFAMVGVPRADAVLGIIVALLIARTGWRILRESVPILVDARGVDAAELRQMVAGIPGISAVRAIRSRATASGKVFVELTIVVSGASSVEAAHALADAVEREIERKLGNADVVVHVEPA